MRITLDAETFRALASTTRLSVLRALDERRKTLTELARDLALNKATVHEHLQLLCAAELVKKRDDEGRKWIYYELTWRGQKILHPQETTTFNVLLGLSVLAAGGGGALLVQALLTANEQAALTNPPPTESPFASPAAAPQADSGSSSASATSSGSPAQGAAAPEAMDQKAALGAAPSSSPAHDSSGLLDHGGGFALALLACGALFGLLSFLLRFRLRPKQPESPGLE